MNLFLLSPQQTGRRLDSTRFRKKLYSLRKKDKFYKVMDSIYPISVSDVSNHPEEIEEVLGKITNKHINVIAHLRHVKKRLIEINDAKTILDRVS